MVGRYKVYYKMYMALLFADSNFLDVKYTATSAHISWESQRGKKCHYISKVHITSYSVYLGPAFFLTSFHSLW